MALCSFASHFSELNGFSVHQLLDIISNAEVLPRGEMSLLLSKCNIGPNVESGKASGIKFEG
jgi:hypothetical protein